MPNVSTDDLVTNLQMVRSRYLYGLEKTAEDRLSWSPGGEAKTPLQLAGKTAAFLGFLTMIVSGASLPEGRRELPPAPETVEDAKAAVDGAFGALIAAVQGLTDADLERTFMPPWKVETPIRAFLWAVPGIVMYHMGQLNYLQTAYGDTDPNIPPDWFAPGG